MAAFVIPLPTSGKVGSSISILGTSLGSASAVSFNGIHAQFKVQGSSRITATVPSGATSGTVTVTVSSGTLSSNVPFIVQ